MPPFKDAFIDHQLKRWMRPDARHFMRPDWRRYVRPGFERDFPSGLYERKYSPDQPRDYHGRWTDGGEADVQNILDKANRFYAAGNNDYQRCLDLCYPILERFSRPGSDLNTFDFHKCMNACQGKN